MQEPKRIAGQGQGEQQFSAVIAIFRVHIGCSRHLPVMKREELRHIFVPDHARSDREFVDVLLRKSHFRDEGKEVTTHRDQI